MKQRADVNNALAKHSIATLYASPTYSLVSIGEIVSRVQYGSSSRASSENIGLPMIRMNNLQDDGWDLRDLKYIDLPRKEAEGYLLNQGDLLFNRTNSKELVGKCAVFREAGEWVFASYLIRVTLNSAVAMPDFVSEFLATKAGRAQIDRVSRQIAGMTNVNAEEIKALQVPLPPLDIQRRLVLEMQAARTARQTALDEADKLLAGLDKYLLDELGLSAPEGQKRRSIGVKLRQLRNSRVDPLPFLANNVGKANPESDLRELGTVADIDTNAVAGPKDDSTLVPYIGLPECDLNHVQEVVMRPYREVRGRSVIRPGDILFARIEPSVFNRKYVLADDLKGHECAYTSTEFYVVRAKEEVCRQNYLYAMFHCAFVFSQVRGITTGSSGRRRVDPQLFQGLKIPLPRTLQQQDAIAAEVTERRDHARNLRAQATTDWEAAKAQFERQLLGEAAA